MRRLIALFLLAVLAPVQRVAPGIGSISAAPPAPTSSSWSWPVVGPVIRAFDPPFSTYGPGHRGIDIATPAGTVIDAVAAGTVTFAGRIGSSTFVTVDHGGGLSSTYSWVSVLLVRGGDRVAAGEPVAISGQGHPGDAIASLHLGAKRNGVYVDPMTYLRAPSVSAFIHLAPMANP